MSVKSCARETAAQLFEHSLQAHWILLLHYNCCSPYSRDYHYREITMAVSRNIMMRASRTFAFGSTRTFATSRIAASAPWQSSFQPVKCKSTFASTRAYSSEAPSSALEPPDYLDENELKVFNKLKEALQPVRLEVCEIGNMQARDYNSS